MRAIEIFSAPTFLELDQSSISSYQENPIKRLLSIGQMATLKGVSEQPMRFMNSKNLNAHLPQSSHAPRAVMARKKKSAAARGGAPTAAPSALAVSVDAEDSPIPSEDTVPPSAVEETISVETVRSETNEAVEETVVQGETDTVVQEDLPVPQTETVTETDANDEKGDVEQSTPDADKTMAYEDAADVDPELSTSELLENVEADLDSLQDEDDAQIHQESSDPHVLHSVIAELRDELERVTEREVATSEAIDALSNRTALAEQRAMVAETNAVQAEDRVYDLKSKLVEYQAKLTEYQSSGETQLQIASNSNTDSPGRSAAQSAVMDFVTKAAEDAAAALGRKSHAAASNAMSTQSRRTMEREVELARDEATSTTERKWRSVLLETETKHAEIVNQLRKKLDDVRSKSERDFVLTSSRDKEASTTIQALQSEVKALEEQLVASDKARRDAEETFQKTQNKADTYFEQVKQLEDQLTVNEEMSKRKFAMCESGYLEQLKQTTGEVEAVRRSLNDADAEIIILKKQLAAEKDMRVASSAGAELINQERNRHDSRIIDLETAAEESRARCVKLGVKCADLEIERQTLKAEVVSVSDKLDVAKREKNYLQNTLDELEKSNSKSKEASVKYMSMATQSESRLIKANARVEALEKALATRSECTMGPGQKSQNILSSQSLLNDSAFGDEDETNYSYKTSESTDAATLRTELDALHRIAEIQEEEVCRAAAVAAKTAESAANESPTTSLQTQTHIAAVAAASVPRALLERWRVETFRLLLQQREGPLLAAAEKAQFSKVREALREEVDVERRKLKNLKSKVQGLELELSNSKKENSGDAEKWKGVVKQRDLRVLELTRETERLAQVVKASLNSFNDKCQSLESSVDRSIVNHKKRISRVEVQILHTKNKIQASESSSHASHRISKDLRHELNLAVHARDAALEAVRDTAKNFDDESERMGKQCRGLKAEVERLESSLSESRREQTRLRHEVVQVADAADTEIKQAVSNAVTITSKRLQETFEADSRRLRLAAETATREAERLGVKILRLEQLVVKTEQNCEIEIREERKLHEETIAKKESTIRELRLARDALLAEQRELKASAAAAHATRRVEKVARRDTLETLERINASSPSFGTGRAAVNSAAFSSPIHSPARKTPTRRSAALVSPVKQKTSLHSMLASQTRGEGEVTRSKTKRTLTKKMSRDDPDLSFYAPDDMSSPPTSRMLPVSLEDLEKSPSWQLQRRLESLEARAAALLLDEEEEAARR